MNAESLYAPRDQPEKKRERERENDWHGRPSCFGERGPIALLLKGAFIPCHIHRGKWKMQSHTESAQTLHLFCLYRNQDFSANLINNVVYIIFCPWRPVNILWPSFDKGFSTRKLIFPWNVFSCISNLCQPQKVLNKVTFSRSKGAVSYKKEPISSKVWCG